MKNKKRAKAGRPSRARPVEKAKAKPRAQQAARLRYARNPGVGTLMLVNPSRVAPIQTELVMPTTSKKPPTPAPVKAPTERKAKVPKQKKKRGRRRAAPATAAVEKAMAQAVKKMPSYQELLNRPRRRKSKAKSPTRGIKTLERNRRSIFWNASRGTDAARDWLRKHIPQANPGTAKAIGLGVASFLGSRVAANLAARIPFLDRLGPHGPVLTSAALAGLTYFLTKKKPELRTPLLYGAGFALLDAVLKNYVPAYLPSAAGVLGDCGHHARPALEAYDEPMRYLPPADYGYPGQSGLGMEVHEAQAGFDDAGDGLGMEVHEAQAGMDGYVPTHSDGTGAYVPSTGAAGYVATGTGDDESAMSGYVPAPTGMSGPFEDAASFMFGGPAAFAMSHLRHRPAPQHQIARAGQVRPMVVRRRGPHGDELVRVNVFCPPVEPHHMQHAHHAPHPHQAHHQRPFAWRGLLPGHVPTTPMIPPVAPSQQVTPMANSRVAAPPAMHGMGGEAGGIFATD